MGTMEGLLQEMKSVTKRTLIKLDHKRRPPERLPEVIYYGADIPRELQNRFLLEGGFSYFEGTPLMIALIWKSQITIQGFLFTTVGVYACENYTKIDSDAYTTAPPEYPVRYDRYREIRPTKEPGGYFGDRFEMHGKDGSVTTLSTLNQVFLYAVLKRCVEYIQMYGPVETKPPRIRTAEEEMQALIMEKYLSDPICPVYKSDTKMKFHYIPAMNVPTTGRSPYEKKTTDAARRRMDAFGNACRLNQLEKATKSLLEAAKEGHADAIYILGVSMLSEDLRSAFDMLNYA